jgi:hypothetical protein
MYGDLSLNKIMRGAIEGYLHLISKPHVVTSWGVGWGYILGFLLSNKIMRGARNDYHHPITHQIT